ncbi:PHD finger protein MALE MEIOCYTE DEATH 1 [Triticum aestivum]|uniref:PHD finger protein MALE MEIOCYTE DEATH 1 n=1 Tax=Triticum aestivum TaxID=4565 RepID=UPI001D00BD06|nr:PHD finger protein MALE MEIOCYTE DEATH 1-like [Triticum aestivum]
MPSIRALMRLAAPHPPPAGAAGESPPQPQRRCSGSPRLSSPSSSSASAPARPSAAAAPPQGPVYPLRDFPGSEAAALCGAFRDNAPWLLARWAPVAAASSSPGPAARRAFLSDDRTGALVPVVAVEVPAASSPAPLCGLCRCAGWSHHWVSKRSYHFIIPTDADWDQHFGTDALLGRSDHLLHGLIHCNGFGHLVALRGGDGGSAFLSGHDIMDIWDRLCSALRVRAVSLVDFSRKHSMDLRLLLGVANGETWFTRWGYCLGRRCFNMSTSAYATALESLASLHVDHLRSRHVRRVVTIYRRLSNKPLITVREFLRCLLDWKHHEAPLSPPPVKPCSRLPFLLPRPCTMKRSPPCKRFEDVIDLLHCRWSKKRMLNAAEVVVEKLLEHGNDAEMTRQAVRDAARVEIGDTGLLDFVIKSLGDTVVGNHIVRRLPSTVTRVLTFSLEEWGEPVQMDVEVQNTRPAAPWPSTVDVERDLCAVYRAMVEALSGAAQAVLDCKHWVKCWGLGDESDDQLRFLVEWRPQPWEAAELTRPLPSGEIVVVPVHTSIGELIIEAEHALRDTYCFFEEFQAETLDGITGEKWDPVVLGGAESGDTIGVHGHGADMETGLRCEGGLDMWEVRCVCGARDDDGERMVACDACDVWHHTRCVGLADSDAVPPLFLCILCGGALLAAGPMLEEALTLAK